MTRWERIKCMLGFHGHQTNTGAGRGSLIVEGHQLVTECRIWRCDRCGAEEGVVTCPSLAGWGSQTVSADFVRRTSGYRDFDTANNGVTNADEGGVS